MILTMFAAETFDPRLMWDAAAQRTIFEGVPVAAGDRRDVKLSLLVETYDAEMLSIYGKACGWALARAHAKAGDPWTISGYLGNGGQFDEAMGKFALAYADQAERDHAALRTAVRAGIVEVQIEH